MFWQKSRYFTLGGCVAAARLYGLATLHPYSSTAISLKWMRFYRLISSCLSNSLWDGLLLQCLLLWLHGCEVGLSSWCCLTITIWGYFSLGGCCCAVREYFTLRGCCSCEKKLLLFESDGSLAFLETDAICLLILGALFLHRIFMRPSWVAVAWLIRILASSLSTT